MYKNENTKRNENTNVSVLMLKSNKLVLKIVQFTDRVNKGI